MIQRETAEPVIKYLHGLTYDGVLSSEEIWNLAQWLNQQPKKILEAWPANELVKALNSAFADNELTAGEMDELAQLMITIEQLWMEFAPRVGEHHEEEKEEVVAAAPGKPHKAALPEFDFSTTLEGGMAVELKKHTCTCNEWLENRTDFSEGDFRRFCPHMAKAYSRLKAAESAKLDPAFDAFVEDYRSRGKGTSVDEVWQVADLKAGKILYATSPTKEWVDVYAPGRSGYQRYGYNRKEHRWAYGETPRQIARDIPALFARATANEGTRTED